MKQSQLIKINSRNIKPKDILIPTLISCIGVPAAGLVVVIIWSVFSGNSPPVGIAGIIIQIAWIIALPLFLSWLAVVPIYFLATRAIHRGWFRFRHALFFGVAIPITATFVFHLLHFIFHISEGFYWRYMLGQMFIFSWFGVFLASIFWAVFRFIRRDLFQR